MWRLVALIALLLSVAVPPLSPTPAMAQSDSTEQTLFPETGFRLGSPQFADYFRKRGGLRTFGYPVSRSFLFLGTQVQFFQRQIMQLRPDGSVTTLNILDADLMPYTRINGSTFPATSATVLAGAPPPGAADYAERVLVFVQANAADTFNGQPVNFQRTFLNTVLYEEAFPTGEIGPGIMPSINLELWGVPTSAPAADPANGNFIYLRFQRGIMHFDAATGATQGLLLADYLKAIITGINLPPDLEEQARTSRFYRQYAPGRPQALARPTQLPGTDLATAFVPDDPNAAAPVPGPAAPSRRLAPVVDLNRLQYGMDAHLWWQDQNREVNLVKTAGFGWVGQQVPWSYVERVKGQPDWAELDRMVDAAMQAGVNVMFSVVSSPSWSRADGRNNGPPDNPADFASFAGQLAARYRGQVRAYEIWNEQNFAREWGGGRINAGEYVELLKAAYPAIKASDPEAVVITGAPTPNGFTDPNIALDDALYLEQMYQYQNGVVRTVSDVIGAHGGGFNSPPEATPVVANTPQATAAGQYRNHPSFYFRRIEQLREVMVRYGDTGKKMWLTEFGWCTANPAPGYEYCAANTEQQQADYLVRAYAMARVTYPWVGAMFVWNLNFAALPDIAPTDEKPPFSIIRRDFSPRPAYTALRLMSKT
ncbi:MAG TPA: cellulase family glycosylhydrolase [Chloroflexota bacterium]|nr:cellulase family glycosylhydrolase [Chloroflexota bacterium]